MTHERGVVAACGGRLPVGVLGGSGRERLLGGRRPVVPDDGHAVRARLAVGRARGPVLGGGVAGAGHVAGLDAHPGRGLGQDVRAGVVRADADGVVEHVRVPAVDQRALPRLAREVHVQAVQSCVRVGGRGLGLLEVHGHGVGHAVQGGLEDAGCVRAEGRGDGVALADVGLVAGGAGVAEGVLVGDGVGGHGDRVFVPRRVEAADVVSAGGAIRLALDQAQAGDNIGCLLRGVQRNEIERGQVLAKPGTLTCHTKFTAQVYVLTKDEGGRHTPFFNNYRPQFYFRTTDVTGVCELPAGIEMCMPGDNVEMTVELIHPVAMEEGLRFAIREGGRTVGSGTVAKIIE